MKPNPEPVSPALLPQLARETMKRALFPMLATVGPDGQPRVRPVSPLFVEGFTVWVASLHSSNKTAELESDARVELCYLDENHDQVRITGRARLIDDEETRRRFWDTTPLLRGFLGSFDNPEYVLYRIDPERVRFMREWALEYHEVPIA